MLAAYVIPPIPTHFCVAWSVVCLSVSQIRACCLNHLMHLDAIWQVYLWGPVTLY